MKEELEHQKALGANFDKAEQERNIPGMIDALMEHPTLLPQPEYPTARQKVCKNLEEESFVWVLAPAPVQTLEPPAYERLSEFTCPLCSFSALKTTLYCSNTPTRSNMTLQVPGA
jgi:hypothetical protein